MCLAPLLRTPLRRQSYGTDESSCLVTLDVPPKKEVNLLYNSAVRSLDFRGHRCVRPATTGQGTFAAALLKNSLDETISASTLPKVAPPSICGMKLL
jgi:hypothetical protein